MASCAVCGKSILYGGFRDGELWFCNQSCREHGPFLRMTENGPVDLVAETVQRMRQGNCPLCGGPGPVDIYYSHRVWSIVVLTSWSTKSQISCRSCGTKSQWKSLAMCALLGWWGFPLGIIFTPIQIARNLGELLHSPDPSAPSPELEQMVRRDLARQAFKQAPLV